MFEWLKHAFAVGSNRPSPTVTQLAAIDAVCREIVRRQMVLPAQMMLESSAPLHFISGQMLRFLEPFLSIILEPSAIKEFATFLEQRGAAEFLCQRLAEIQRTEAGEPRT